MKSVFKYTVKLLLFYKLPVKKAVIVTPLNISQFVSFVQNQFRQNPLWSISETAMWGEVEITGSQSMHCFKRKKNTTNQIINLPKCTRKIARFICHGKKKEKDTSETTLLKIFPLSEHIVRFHPQTQNFETPRTHNEQQHWKVLLCSFCLNSHKVGLQPVYNQCTTSIDSRRVGPHHVPAQLCT